MCDWHGLECLWSLLVMLRAVGLDTGGADGEVLVFGVGIILLGTPQ